MEQKQKLLPVVAKTASVATAMSLCLALTGCYNLYEGKADKNLQTAEQWQAGEFEESRQAFEQARQALQAARQAKSGGNSGEARTQAQSAAELSETAMDAAMRRFADVQLANAEQHMKVASDNQVDRGATAQDYTTAQENLNKARQELADQDFKDSINLSNQVIASVNMMLRDVQNKAEDDVRQLGLSVQSLEQAQGETYTPAELDRGRQALTLVQQMVADERAYRRASLMAETARGDADSATIESKRRHSQTELLALEDKISEAIAEEAPVHVPDRLERVQMQYESLLATFYNNQFDTVLAGARSLRPEADELITAARIESTRALIGRVNDTVTALRAEDVETYLPGQIAEVEQIGARAQIEFDNNNYEGSKLEARNALQRAERVTLEFDTLAQAHYRAADAATSSTRDAYARMTRVFGAAGTTIDSRLSSRYQVRATDLAARLNSAVDLLNSAEENREANQFKSAITQADQAGNVAEEVANGTYTLVAENALLGVQDQISELERQGASQYAPRSLREVQALVGRTQEQLRNNQAREAAESAARARAEVENVKQEIANRAVREANDTDRLLQRIEGGAGPAPAAGGMRYMGVPQRQLPFGEAPGGSLLSNKEAMFLEAVSAAEALPAEAGVIVAQTSVGNPTNSSGWTGSPAVIQNRQIPGGTFATSDAPSNVFLGTGMPTGAAIGHRAEPVVNTYEATGAYRSGSAGAYEAPTAPGPFMAMPEPDAIDPNEPVGLVPAAAEINGARQRLEDLMGDNQRLKDLEDFEPTAVEAARRQLRESSEALSAQDYSRAVRLAREAQSTIFVADRNASRQAANRDLQAAADRINLAQAAAADMFAPAQLMEARRLYDQGNAFISSGDYREARKLAARALVASEDARSYNVTKARDLAAQSVDYGGYRASVPALTEANRLSDIADDMMRSPETAAQGQEVAKQAVMLGQIALDHARDYSYQERLDNIYKALNQALRAGANYFNVTEVRRLIAELAIARDQYCTRNFDAVEIKLRDIEARLARVIETTPLVLEENLIETTEKLNALVLAGAENWMAQEVDNVKSLMNRSVIDFRKHDYQSSYTNIRNAMALTDRIENRLQEQVYFDSVTELFAQLDDTFHKFRPVINHSPAFLKKLVSTEWGQPRAMDLSSRLNPNEFKDKINDIYLRAIHLKPPKSQEAIHTEVIIAIKHAKVASENFQKLYILDQVNMPDAYEIIDTAYAQIKRAQTLRGEVQVKMIEPQARMRVIRAEKIVNY